MKETSYAVTTYLFYCWCLYYYLSKTYQNMMNDAEEMGEGVIKTPWKIGTINLSFHIFPSISFPTLPSYYRPSSSPLFLPMENSMENSEYLFDMYRMDCVVLVNRHRLVNDCYTSIPVLVGLIFSHMQRSAYLMTYYNAPLTLFSFPSL